MVRLSGIELWKLFFTFMANKNNNSQKGSDQSVLLKCFHMNDIIRRKNNYTQIYYIFPRRFVSKLLAIRTYT